MNAAMHINPTFTEAMNHWQYVEPYATVPKTKAEYKKQRLLLENLVHTFVTMVLFTLCPKDLIHMM